MKNVSSRIGLILSPTAPVLLELWVVRVWTNELGSEMEYESEGTLKGKCLVQLKLDSFKNT